MGGIRHEAPLPGERLLQPVQHVVERLRQPPRLDRPLGRHPGGELAGVDRTGDSGHPADRPGASARDEDDGDQRRNERDGAGHEEGPGHARLGRLDG